MGLVLKGLNQDILLKAEVHFEKLGKKNRGKVFYSGDMNLQSFQKVLVPIRRKLPDFEKQATQKPSMSAQS